MFAILLIASAVMFPRDGLEPGVQFWKDVFTTYGERHLIFHDAKHVHLVYKTVDLEAEGISLTDLSARRNAEAFHREEIIRSLQQIGARTLTLGPMTFKAWPGKSLKAESSTTHKFLQAEFTFSAVFRNDLRKGQRGSEG